MVTNARGRSKGKQARPRQNKAQVGLPARRQALKLVTMVLGKSQPFTVQHDSDGISTGNPGLTTRDMALARNIALTTLRHRGELDAILAKIYERGMPGRSGNLHAILLTAACQVLFMDVANHAAVDLAVRLARYDRHARHHAGLANAGLRRIAREGADMLAALDGPRLNTPDWLWTTWCTNWGEETAHKIAVAHMREPMLDITPANDPEIWAEKLEGQLLTTGSIRMENRGAIETLPGYKDGVWWVQDAAAALPVKLFGNVKGLTIIDLCAAPGGKTMQLAAGGANVIAVDRAAKRLEKVTDNLRRSGLKAEIVARDALDWSPSTPADAVLLDAPCTATGTIRRHPDVAQLKSTEDRDALVPLQAKLLDRAIEMVRPGGTIVYCTCSLEPEECEKQIEDLLERNKSVSRKPILADEISDLEEAITEKGDLRTLPFMTPGGGSTHSGMDGFYAARLMKSSEVE